MTAEQFLDLLEQRGVLPKLVVDDLHGQVSRAGGPIHPIQIARRLVERGYLNPFFAKNLLAEKAPAAPEASTKEIDLAPLEGPIKPISAAGAEQEALFEEADLMPIQIDLDPLEDSSWMTSWTGEDIQLLPAAKRKQGLAALFDRLGLQFRRVKPSSLWWLVGGVLLVLILIGLALVTR